MPQLRSALASILPDALTSDRKRRAHFLECMLAAVVQAEAHLITFSLARREVLSTDAVCSLRFS